MPSVLRERCPVRVAHDIAIAVDNSETALNLPRWDARDTTIQLAEMTLHAGPHWVGVVAYHDTATLMSPLSGDVEFVYRAVDRMRPTPVSCLPCGIDVAAAELGSQRRRPTSAPLLVTVVSEGATARPQDEAVRSALAAKDAGTTVAVVWLGPGADTEFLAALASDPGLVLVSPDADALEAAFAPLIRTWPPTRLWPHRWCP